MILIQCNKCGKQKIPKEAQDEYWRAVKHQFVGGELVFGPWHICPECWKELAKLCNFSPE